MNKVLCSRCGEEVGLAETADELFELLIDPEDNTVERGDLIETFPCDQSPRYECTNGECCKKFTEEELLNLEKIVET